MAYVWLGSSGFHDEWTRKSGGDYYGALTDAFLAGQTYLKIEPSKELLALKNPYADSARVPRLHDATFFRGRYYIYFGPGPVIFLFGPWRLVVGNFLSEGAGTLVFVSAGFLFGCALLWNVWRRWFTALPPLWLGVAVLLWGFGSYPVILLPTPGLYSVPTTFAFACLMATVLVLWKALTAPTWRMLLTWFALGSLLWAVSLSGRPNYLFSLPVLAVPFFFLLGRLRREFGDDKTKRFHLGLAVTLPVGIVGALLAAYNWIRYGSVTEFGVHWQMAMGDQSATKLFEVANFPANLGTYLLSFPIFSPYFPFIDNYETGYGLLRCTPLALLALAFPFCVKPGSLARDRPWLTLGLILLFAGLMNFVALLGVPWGNERYSADYLPAFLLAGILSLWAILRSTPATRYRWLTRTAALTLATWTLAIASVVLIARYPNRERLAPLSRVALRLADGVERWRGVGHGPLHLKVTFPPAPVGTTEPLVVSALGRDLLFAKFLGDGRVQFGFFHEGNTAVTGEPVAITPGQSYDLEVNLGSLYPPPGHPALDGWTATQLELLFQTVSVRLEGIEVLHTNSKFYRTHPDDILLGANPRGLLANEKFSGTLTRAAAQIMPRASDLISTRPDGPVRLTLSLPPYTVYRREPLVSTGFRGKGDVVFVTYLGPGQISFGHDSWNGGAVETEKLNYDSTRQQEIEIDLGSLRKHDDPEVASAPLVIRFNGRTLLRDVRPFHPSPPEQVLFGYNGTGSSIVSQAFGGKILRVENLRELPVPAPVTAGSGPVHLGLRFDTITPGRSEPLLVTGRTGAADLVYVTYVDATHVRFGCDHWGVGSTTGAPVEITDTGTHALDISLGSLYPEKTDPRWESIAPADAERLRTRILIQFDGTTVLDAPLRAHPITPDQVYVGVNSVGGSSCAENFSGKILIAEQAPFGGALGH